MSPHEEAWVAKLKEARGTSEYRDLINKLTKDPDVMMDQVLMAVYQPEVRRRPRPPSTLDFIEGAEEILSGKHEHAAGSREPSR